MTYAHDRRPTAATVPASKTSTHVFIASPKFDAAPGASRHATSGKPSFSTPSTLQITVQYSASLFSNTFAPSFTTA
ncbi:hypothetical protein E2P81_ATG05041 [Venturia nashicola]|nr:hypothetical protein E2P81_ATG05041 [Venturia nashicola]